MMQRFNQRRIKFSSKLKVSAMWLSYDETSTRTRGPCYKPMLYLTLYLTYAEDNSKKIYRPHASSLHAT